MPVADEEALFGGEETCRLIVDTAEEGICILDKNDTFTFVSNRMVELLGYAKQEFLGRKIFEFTDPEHGESIKAALERRRKGQREVYTTKLRKKGGDFIWAIFAATPLYDKNGAYLGSLVLVSDITQLKQTEEHLRYEKSKGDMYLDMMSHDINNMNQAAMGFMELARDKLEKEGSLSKDDLHLIVKPIESLKRASELLENIKTLQKLRTGKIGSEVLDVSEILAQVIDEQASVSHRNIDFNYFQRENCPVKANLLLKEAFRNIIGNAIKHSSGPLTINLTVKCMKENNKSYCEVVCEDNGPGIQDNVKRDLFQRYRSGNTKTPGMGLGLYIVKTLIDSFGGRVWVEDRVPGDHTKGAKFVILLPEVKS